MCFELWTCCVFVANHDDDDDVLDDVGGGQRHEDGDDGDHEHGPHLIPVPRDQEQIMITLRRQHYKSNILEAKMCEFLW